MLRRSSRKAVLRVFGQWPAGTWLRQPSPVHLLDQALDPECADVNRLPAVESVETLAEITPANNAAVIYQRSTILKGLMRKVRVIVPQMRVKSIRCHGSYS